MRRNRFTVAWKVERQVKSLAQKQLWIPSKLPDFPQQQRVAGKQIQAAQQAGAGACETSPTASG
jgi:hypothetical protein